jgi:hypothetical protein
VTRRFVGHTLVAANADLDAMRAAADAAATAVLTGQRRLGTATLGNADVALLLTDKRYQIGTLALTAQRNVTLPAVTAANAGAFFHLVRPSTGAFNYVVKRADASVVTTLATGTWALLIVDPAGVWQILRRGLTGSGVATRLEIVRQPAGAVGGAAFATQPIVRVVDAIGNLVTSPAVNVTATPSGGATIGGTVVATVNGVATFVNLGFADTPLTTAPSRTLTFSSPGLASVDSALFVAALGNDMIGWYRADDAANTFDGAGHLATTYDRTGHGNVLAATGVIQKVAAILNGKDGFDFSTAGANYLSDITIGVQGSFTWFGVFKITAGATYQNLFDTAALPTTWFFWDQPGNGWQVGDRIAGVGVAGAYVTMVIHYINLGAQVQVVVRVNGAGLMNTFLTAPGGLIPGAAGVPANKTFQSFHRNPAQYPFTSRILEWGFYSLSKNGAEGALEAYLRAQYATW